MFWKDKPALVILDEDTIHRKSGITIFGRDIANIPCFKDSYLYGLSGGLGVFLLHFFVTSNLRWSCHYGFGTCMAVQFSYWTICRRNRDLENVENAQLYEALKNRTSILDDVEVDSLLETEDR